ncbi:DoxX family protein [Croceiramulus getboli]|nr:DoxX family protein [Flavobacteriaceae bacterium YJPT1-3]
MKINRIIYWTATLLFCGLMLYSASFYLMDTPTVENLFEEYGYPGYLVLPLALAKIQGVLMLLLRKPAWLTEWAYAGFAFDIVLAFFVHFQADEDTTTTLVALILLLISYFFGKSVRPLYG